MPCDVVLGGQWGDEGKGKIIDVLAARAHAVVRCQGGANAGHTLVHGDTRLALHQVPSGVRYPDCLGILANGMVVDPLALLEEIEALERAGLEVRSRLRVSTGAHLVLPCHRLQDRVEEERRGAARVGTTGRGIGPAYADKAARRGLRLGALALPAAELRSALQDLLREKRLRLQPEADLDIEAEIETILECRDRIVPLLADTTGLVLDLLERDESVLLEGAQGTLLDIDHGSYPYVTSSACTTAGALAGCGLPAQSVRHVIGVYKAYATRVGNGPFPSEATTADAERLRSIGGEFGATTGRPRRCGWFDVVAARHAARLNGFTSIALTKLDVLDGFETVRVCVAYEAKGTRFERFPSDPGALANMQPVWREVPGWRQPTTGARQFADLPDAARRYVDFLQETTGVRIGMVSVGPDRDRTLQLAP